MRAYTVHTPPDGDPQRTVFVKDGFAWPAFFFGPLWILWHRMWVTLVWYVVLVLLVAWAGRLGGEDLSGALSLLLAFLLGFEGNDIRRRSLASRSYADAGATEGRNFVEAETRFFARDEPPPSLPRREVIARAAYPPAARQRGADEPILGLFPEPER
jgi:hypothetical protein